MPIVVNDLQARHTDWCGIQPCSSLCSQKRRRPRPVVDAEPPRLTIDGSRRPERSPGSSTSIKLRIAAHG
jgi:hypothetical protein